MLGLELGLAGIFEGVPFGIAGLGFALIFRTAKELNFAFGATIAVGGYVTFAAVSSGVPLVIAMLLSVVVGALIGILLRWGIFARLRDHFAVLLFSFGLAVILENVLHLVFGAHDVVAESPAMRLRITLVPGTNLAASVVQLVGLGILLVAWLATWWMLARTKVGLGLTAVIRDADMSELVGVSSSRMKVLAYALGSALAGIAGSLTVLNTGVRPSLGFELLLYGFIATLLAGNKFVHAAIWGVLLGVVLNLSAVWLPSQYRTLVVFVLLIAYLIARMARMPRIAI